MAIYEYNPIDVDLSHSNARPSIEKYPWLLLKCWKGAFSGALPEKTSQKLYSLLEKAINREERLIQDHKLEPKILNTLISLKEHKQSSR